MPPWVLPAKGRKKGHEPEFDVMMPLVKLHADGVEVELVSVGLVAGDDEK